MRERMLRVRDRFARVKPWAAIAVLASAALLAYYGTLGVRYWEATGEVARLSSKVRQLSATVRRPIPDTGYLEEQLAARDARRSQLEGLFVAGGTQSIVKLLSAAAEKSGTGLGSISIGDSLTRDLAGTELQARPVSLVLSGEMDRIYEFLFTVRESTPAISVGGVRIARAGDRASVSFQLQFYLPPWSAEQE